MTDRRYVPRSFTLDPLDFGRPGAKLRWIQPPTTAPEVDWLAAAKIQHSWSVRIRAAIIVSVDFASVKEFAQAQGLNYARLSRMLRGEVVMRLEDVTSAQRILISMSRNSA